MRTGSKVIDNESCILQRFRKGRTQAVRQNPSVSDKTLDEVRAASSVSELTDCKKIESLNNVYRLRIGDRRAFFVLHILIEGDLVKFEYLFNRGEAYYKKNMEKLRGKDI